MDSAISVVKECSRGIGGGDNDGVMEEKGEHSFEQSVICADEDEHNRLRLRLPVKDEYGNYRSVDAHCAICFSNYKCGEKIVWSGLQCQHAFHYDCMLPWLIKGKKRCPICRDWFVPGSNIQDQKKQLEERLYRESDGSNSETETMERGSPQDTTNLTCTSLDNFDGERVAKLEELKEPCPTSPCVNQTTRGMSGMDLSSESILPADFVNQSTTDIRKMDEPSS
jgi:hypothetical protein